MVSRTGLIVSGPTSGFIFLKKFHIVKSVLQSAVVFDTQRVLAVSLAGDIMIASDN